MYFILIFCLHINCYTYIFIFVTILDIWIFSNPFNKGCSWPIVGGPPRSSRWTSKHSLSGWIVEYQHRLGTLTIGDVIWTPYEDHRHTYTFDVVLLSSGYFWWCDNVVLYWLERCLRQFWYIQHIPSSLPTHPPPSVDYIFTSGNVSILQAIKCAAVPTT